MAFTEILLYITEGNGTIKNPYSFKNRDAELFIAIFFLERA